MRYLLRHSVLTALAVGILAPAADAHARVDVVASIPELAAIAREVGGDRVRVHSIARPNQNYHMVDPRPSDVARLSHADVFVRVGMDLDLWADALLASARNRKVSKGGPGYVDASTNIQRIQVPTAPITGAAGDIHAFGNPHYYYDPVHAKTIAGNILEALVNVAPQHKAAFEENYRRFTTAIDAAMVRWRRELASARGKPVVTYHKDYDYFMQRFGIRDFGNLEPRPGIPPSPAHINRLIESMERENVRALVIASIYPRRFPEIVAKRTGANLVWAPFSVGSLGTKDYIGFIDAIVQAFRKACR